MNNPLISIIVPAYNVAAYLPACLDSLLHQTYSDIEIIVVNDGSTDRTLDIIRQYQSEDERIRLIDQLNKGVSESRNIALKKAEGKYVLFVDADDWLDAKTIQSCLERILKVNADVCFFAYISEFPKSSHIRNLYFGDRIFEGKECENLQRRMIGPVREELAMPQRLDSYGTIWGKFYRKEILDGVSFEDLKVIGSAEDSLFNCYVFQKVKKAIYLDQPFYHYRRDNVSVTSRFRPHLLQQWTCLFEKMAGAVQNTEGKEALQNRIAISLLGYSLNVHAADLSFWQKKKLISTCLNLPVYEKAYRQIKYSYFPLYWRSFFISAKHKYAIIVLILSYLIQWMRK